MLAGLRCDRSVRDVCREHEISETQYSQWRDRLLEAGRRRRSGRTTSRPNDAELREALNRTAQLEGALSRDRSRTIAGLGVSQRVARA